MDKRSRPYEPPLDEPRSEIVYPQTEHDAIVDQLRRRGWDRVDANEEADILMARRIARREAMSEHKKFDDLGDLSPGDVIYSSKWADGVGRKGKRDD